jgi:diaminopimelate decarboxylase
MHEFKYKSNKLYCEKVTVEVLAKKFGTPLYVYSYATLIDHYNKLKSAFRKVNPLICYSALVEKGAGLDIVSGGELFHAIKAGCPPEKIVYASVGKTDGEIRVSIKRGILFFNVESTAELENINRIAKIFNRVVNIAIRINPDVEPKTHKFIATGKLTNKFGIDFEAALKIFLQHSNFSNLNICGLHVHIGSQITEVAPYISAILKITAFIKKLEAQGIKLKYLNIGGGLGIVYDKENPLTGEKFAGKISPLLKKTGLKIIMEPGRFIVGNAGILLTKVLYIKSAPLKKFVIVDAGMNDLVRPALYGAYHQILPTSYVRSSASREKVDVVGPICESADYLAKERELPPVNAGDYLAIMGTGAYGFSMASNYNSRRRPAEVLVKGDKAFLIRKRESFTDLIKDELLVEL